VQGIVALHGGEVRAESAGPGQGAEFIIRLPLDEGPAPGLAPPSAGPPISSRRLLVIEDNRDVAEALRQSLEIEGHEVEVAHSGPEGIAKARRNPPEIVLCDIGLPGMSGYELARTVRADPALRSLYLVAVSGYAQHRDVAAALEAGFDEHLAKPVSPPRLNELLGRPPRSAASADLRRDERIRSAQ
jgi:two-component system CheB/CheR fusion protein